MSQQREANSVQGKNDIKHYVDNIEEYVEDLSNTYDLEFNAGRVNKRRINDWEAIREELESNDTTTGVVVAEVQSALGNVYIDFAECESEQAEYFVRYRLNVNNGVCSRVLKSGISAAGDSDSNLSNWAYRAIGESMIYAQRRCDDLLSTAPNMFD